MTAILLKDWLVLLKQGKLFFIFAFFFAAVGAMNEENIFFLVFDVVFLSMISSSLMGFEEQCRWNSFAELLPISRKVQVMEKYLVSLIGVALGILLNLGVHSALGRGFSDMERMVPLLLMIGLIFPTLNLPLIFKMGVSKARVGYIVIVVLIMAIGGGVSKLIGDEELDFFGFFGKEFLWQGAVAVLVMFVLSMLLSIVIYEKKEI